MSVLKSSPLTVLLTCSWIIVAYGDTQVTVKVKPGDDATLECRAHRDGSIEKLEWSKIDLESEYYVFFFRENRSYEKYQLPSFRGRVKLLDPQMKEGDATVVLKNVTANDSGPYECSVSISGGHRRKRAAEFRHIVHLKVEDSGPKAGGSEERVSKEGGSKERGSEERGSKEGGSKERGSEERGSKEGGNLRGGSGLMLLIAVSVVISVSVAIGIKD